MVKKCMRPEPDLHPRCKSVLLMLSPMVVALYLGITGCSPVSTEVPDRPAPPGYCDVNDCSQFPAQHISFRIAEEWHSIPHWSWFYGRDDLGKATRVSISQMPDTKYEYRGGGIDSPEAIASYAHARFVAPEAQYIVMSRCCDGLARHFGAADGETRLGSQVIIWSEPTGSIYFGYDTLRRVTPADKLSEAFFQVSDRYELDVGDVPSLDAESPIPAFVALSRDAMVMESRLWFNCKRHLCDIIWSTHSNGYRIGFHVVAFSPGSCGDDCSPSEQVDHMVDQVEGFARRFEVIWVASRSAIGEVKND